MPIIQPVHIEQLRRNIINIYASKVKLDLHSIKIAVANRDWGGMREYQAVRKRFLASPFETQAGLIIQFAKEGLAEADAWIKEKIPGDVPAAKEVWTALIHCKSGGSDPEKISTSFPQLSSISTDLCVLFHDNFTFWIENFYSCNKYGEISKTPVGILAHPLHYTREQRLYIDHEAEMEDLGFNLQNYARQVIFQKHDEGTRTV
jgi:hypothetical protein